MSARAVRSTLPVVPTTVVEPSSLPERLPEQPYVLFVGPLAPHKGIRQLLAAYERLASPPPMVLIGTTWPNTPRHFPTGVTVLQGLPHPQVMTAWEGCLFGVLPSICAEALGDVVIEAMSAGKAMIGSRAGGIVDLIDDGETGILVPPGDVGALAAAMEGLIRDAALRDRMGQRARVRSEAFTIERIVPRFIALYQDVIGPHPLPATHTGGWESGDASRRKATQGGSR